MIAPAETTPRGPMAFAYGRISHKSQEERESVPAQEKRSRWYWDGVLKPDGIGWAGFHHDGHHLSAYRRPFPKRPAGKKIVAELMPGDHVIFDKVDRVWRSVEDFVVLLAWFRRKQIHVHFVNYLGASFQVDKPMGKFILTMMVSTAELASAETSDRIKKARAHSRSEGRWNVGQVPRGCKLVGVKPNRRLIWDMKTIELVQRVAEMRDSGMTSVRIAVVLEQEDCAATGRTFRASEAHDERFWTKGKVDKLMVYRPLLEVAPHMDPNQINFTELFGRKPRNTSMLTKDLIE